MKFPNDNSGDAMPSTPEDRDSFALAATRRLLAGEAPFPSPVAAAELYFAIRMAVTSSSFTPAAAVETVIGASSARELKSLRNGLFKFYAFTGDNVKAGKLLPKSGKETVCEYQPAMQVYLASGDMKSAKVILPLCSRRIPAEGRAAEPRLNLFVRYGLHVALAAYHARIGNHRKAIEFWAWSSPGDPFFNDAVTTLSYALVVKALSAVRSGINELLNQQVQDKFGYGVVSVLDPLERTPQTLTALETLRTELLRILPQEQRRNFGVGDDGRVRSADGKGGQ